MNKKDNELIKKIKSALDVNGQIYKDQLELSQKDFSEYCSPPNMVNNWQYPQKPPTQAAMAIVARIIETDNILDFGTGLTAYTLLKHTDASVVSIDNSLVWLVRLRKFLVEMGLSTDGLQYFGGTSHHPGLTYNLEKDINPDVSRSIETGEMVMAKGVWNGSLPQNVPMMFQREPHPIRMIGSVGSLATSSELESLSERQKWDLVNTMSLLGYITPNGMCIPVIREDSEGVPVEGIPVSQLGKFTFIQYDFGDMWSRAAYLRCAVSMLDRSRPCVVNVDDLHKKAVYYEGKTYQDIATEVIESEGGVWLHCEEATVDHVGCFSDFAYFPPRDQKD